MKTSSKLTLSLIALSSLAGPMAAQSYLPQNQSAAVRHHFARGDIKKVLRTALNTPGDTITLDIFAYVSGNFFRLVKAGAQGKFEVEVTRAPRGYDVALSFEQSLSIGVNPLANIEANVSVSNTGKVIFGFDSDDAATNGMWLLAVGRMLRLDRAVQAAHTMLLGVERAVNDAKRVALQAAQRMNLAQATYKTMVGAYNASYRVMQFFYRPIPAARAGVARAIAEVRKLEDEMRRAHPVARFFIWIGYKIAMGILETTQRILAEIDAKYREALARHHANGAKVRRKAAEVQRLIQTSIAAEKNKRLRIQARDEVRKVYVMLTNPVHKAAGLRSAVEAQMRLGTDVSAGLGVPGVSLENLGLNAGLGAGATATLRWDLARSYWMPTILTVGANLDVSITGNAGAGLGADATIGNELRVESAFSRIGDRGPFRPHGTKAILTVDMHVSSKVGVGVVAVHGVGRTMTLEINANDWAAARRRAGQKKTAVLTALRSMQTTAKYTVQDRWIAGGRLSFGLDLALFSFQIGGGAIWADRGNEVAQNLRIGSTLNHMSNRNQISQTVRSLRSVRR